MRKSVNASIVTGKRSVLKAKQTTKNNWHAVKKQGKNSEKKGLLKCLVRGCKVWRKSKFAVHQHIKQDHPDFHWKCSVCKKDFAIHQGRYKHELKHKYRFHYDCKTCHYRCMFEGKMEEHFKKHDRKKIAL